MESLRHFHGRDTLVIVADHADHADRSTAPINNLWDIRYPYFLRFLLIARAVFSVLRIMSAKAIDSKDYIFCHTWVSDGLIGLMLKITLGTRYSVLVRKTDLYFYYEKFTPYRFLFRLVLSHADRIAFLSPSLKQSFSERIELCDFLSKSRVWPNGIDDFWHKNLVEFSSDNQISRRKRREVLFVGKFDSNKNVSAVFSAVKLVRKEFPDTRLVCVGGTTKQLGDLIRFTNSDLEWLTVIPKLIPSDLMLQYRRASCLAVPSRQETFGLVFVEALSQACPVIHTTGQAIDKFFEGVDAVQAVPDGDLPALCSAIIASFSQAHTNVPVTRFQWSSLGKSIVDDLENFE